MKFEVDSNGYLKKVLQDDTGEKKIKIPSNVKLVNIDSFEYLILPEQVIFSDSVETIEECCFNYSRTLKKVVLPPKLEIINRSVFDNCSSLKSVKIYDKVKEIELSAFYRCENLKKIKLPSNLNTIGREAFANSALKKVEIPDSVHTVEEMVFYNCEDLKEVKLSSNMKNVSDGMFSDCWKLKKIEMPEGIENIGNRAFIFCKKLKKIEMPDSIKYIGGSAFRGCIRLKEIKLSSSLEVIDDWAFQDCENLERIKIPAGVKKINQGAFSRCSKLEEIEFGNVLQAKEPGIREDLIFKEVYYNKENGSLLVCSNPLSPSRKGYEKIDIDKIREEVPNCSKDLAAIIYTLFNETEIGKMGEIKEILPFIIVEMNQDNKDKILDVFNKSKEFNHLLRTCRSNEYRGQSSRITTEYDIFKLAYSLGAFSDNQIERQKACEFIKKGFDKVDLVYNFFHREFESLKLAEYNKEWAEFFMNKDNFKELINLERYDSIYSGIIGRIHGSFKEIKEFGRSNRGNQRYRKVTIEMAKEYFKKARFDGINPSNEDIAETIAAYTRNQESFDDAIDIRKKYLKSREKGEIKDHILDEELNEEKNKIVKDIAKTLENLNKVSNNKFTYEFLSKNDPRNFVLGKYCSCCAHLEGVGYGIMKASILHPDCQNLIIKDDRGDIIAKSTLYVNRRQGYALCNNVEVNGRIMNKKDREMIYEKYIEALETFVKKYNELYKDAPLTKINVGMHLNDLEDIIKCRHKKSNGILQGINFSSFGKSGQAYNGDWQENQYVILEENNKKR